LAAQAKTHRCRISLYRDRAPDQGVPLARSVCTTLALRCGRL